MGMGCFRCSDGIPVREVNPVYFYHDGVPFKVVGSGNLCGDCLQEQAIKSFKDYGAFIGVEKDKEGKFIGLDVDWNEFLRTAALQFQRARLLEYVGVLSCDPNGCFALLPGFQNITLDGGQLFFFRRFKDIRAYAEAVGSGGLAQRFIVEIKSSKRS